MPPIPKRWKVIYKDGDNSNCSLINLDYIDTTKDKFKFQGSNLKPQLERLKEKKISLQKEIEELDKEILAITYKIASDERRTRKYVKVEDEIISTKQKQKTVKVKNNKPKGRPVGSGGAYLIDRYSQDYQWMNTKDIAEKLSLSESTISRYATQSAILPENPKYALTRKLGDIWDLLEE